MPRFTHAERVLRLDVHRSFAGSRVLCRRGERRHGFVACVVLAGGSWCSAPGATRIEAIGNTLELAREPAPGFPGWVEPVELDVPADVTLH